MPADGLVGRRGVFHLRFMIEKSIFTALRMSSVSDKKGDCIDIMAAPTILVLQEKQKQENKTPLLLVNIFSYLFRGERVFRGKLSPSSGTVSG